MAVVFIGLGSNMGDRKSNLQSAVAAIKKECTVTKISSLYETEPVGYKNQDWFLNCVVKIQTSLLPFALLNFLQGIEKHLKKNKREV